MGDHAPHAAAAVPNHVACELQDLSDPFGLHTDVEVRDGEFVLGERPGIGVEVDEAAVDAVPTVDIGVTDAAGPHVRPADAGLRL
ncbi:hypothetical protein [Pseudonocardia sp. DLS-67]